MVEFALTYSQAFLNRALDPPDMAAMDHALAVLQQLGAVDQSDEVTPLGEHLVCITYLIL